MTDCVNFGVILASSSDADPFVAGAESYAGGDVVKENNYHVPRGEDPTLKVIDLTADFTPVADEFVPTVTDPDPADTTKAPSSEDSQHTGETESVESAADGTAKKGNGCKSVTVEWCVLPLLLVVCFCLFRRKERI